MATEATSVFVGALLAASLVFLAVGHWLHRKEAGRGSRIVVANHAIQGVAALLVAAVTLVPSAAVAVWIYQVAGVVFLLVPLTWFFFALAYAYPERLTRRVKLAVGGYFVVTAALVLTNQLHGLYSRDASFVAEPFPTVTSQPMPLSALSYVAYLIFLAGVVALVYRLLTTMRASRGQLAALLVGLLFPVIYVPVVALGVLPGTVQGGTTSASLGYMLIGSTWPSALVAWAVYRYQLFDVVPLAREAIFEDREEPVFVLDAENRVMDYNRAAVELFPSLEAHAGSSLEAVAPELIDDGGFADTLTRFADAGPREFVVGVSALSTEEGVQGYSLVLRDVTEREQYVRDLEQQTAQLERFASTLSHDLRNPLNVAQARVKNAIQSGSVENLEKADEAHDRIEAMIQDLLTLAREGRTIDEVEPVRLPDVLREAWETTDTRDATFEVAEGADVTVFADADRLQNVFENLLRNAVQHGGDDVTVTLGRTADGFYLEDDGPGVPAEDRDSVFEFGYSTAQSGTGLGLAIVESIARAHGWRVEMTEGSDGGARIVFADVEAVQGAEEWTEPVSVPEPGDHSFR